MVAAKLATSTKPNWTSAKIGDVVEKISTGTTPPSQERRYYDGEIDWYTPSDIGGVRWLASPKKTITSEAVNEKKARMFDAGTILITCIGQIGRVGILPKESSSNQQITGVKFISEIDPEFAYFSLFAKQDELEAAAPTASTLSILNQNRLSEIEFSYPSIKEQKQIAKFLAWCEDRLLSNKPFTNDFPALPDYLNDLPRIVAHIESLAARVNEAQRLREEASEQTIALSFSSMDKVFSGLSSYPQLAIDDVCENIYRYPTFYGMSHLDSGIPVIRIEHILNDGTISKDWGSYWFVSKDVSEKFPMTVLREGDLVMGVRGSIGKLGMIGKEHDGAQLSPNCIRFAPNRKIILPRYLYLYLRSPKGQQAMQDTSTATAISTIKASGIKKARIPVPTLSEQEKIVTYLDGIAATLAKLKQLQLDTKNCLNALLPSVLDEAFKGKL